MSDPIERIRYDDPDAPKLFDPLGRDHRDLESDQLESTTTEGLTK